MAYGKHHRWLLFCQKKKAIHRFLRRHRRFWKLNRCRLDAADGPCTSRTTRMSLCFTVKHPFPTTQNSRFNVIWGKFVVTKTAGWSPNKNGWFWNRESTQDPRKKFRFRNYHRGRGLVPCEACATNASALVGRTFWGLKMGRHLALSFQNHWQSLVLKQMEKWCWLDSFEMEGATSNSLSFLQNFRFAWGCQLVAVFGSMATCRSTRKNVGTNVTALTNLLYDLGQALEVFPSRGRGSGTICHFLIPCC